MKNQKKFAITHVVKNEEEIIKTFPDGNKDEALAFGEEASKSFDVGLVVCISALFNEDNERADNTCWVYEVWKCEEKGG